MAPFDFAIGEEHEENRKFITESRYKPNRVLPVQESRFQVGMERLPGHLNLKMNKS